MGPPDGWLRLAAVGLGHAGWHRQRRRERSSLYRSFEIGKMAVVAPLSASYPALTVHCLFTGEHLTSNARRRNRTHRGRCRFSSPAAKRRRGKWNSRRHHAGATRKQYQAESAGRSSRRRALAFCFGCLARASCPAVGYAATVWMIRLTSSILTAMVILCLRQPISLRRAGPIPIWLAGMGVLDTCAFVMSNYGMQIEQVAVVSVLASLYGAVTVALAAIFLREHISRWQWFGIISIFAGIFLISS